MLEYRAANRSLRRHGVVLLPGKDLTRCKVPGGFFRLWLSCVHHCLSDDSARFTRRGGRQRPLACVRLDPESAPEREGEGHA